MRVAVLHNHVPDTARLDDLDTLVQAQAVRDGLISAGHQAWLFPLRDDDAGWLDSLRAGSPQAVFNLVESYGGGSADIHLAPLAMEEARLPFTGAGSDAMHASTDKLLAKARLRDAGLPTPAWLLPRDMTDPARPLSGEWIVKSVKEHASLGLDEDSVVAASCVGDLLRVVRDRAARFGGEWFAEEYVEGREFNIGVLDRPDGPMVLPHAEIVFRGYGPERRRIVGWAAKWEEGTYEYDNTPRTFDFPDSDAPLLAEITRLSLACWRAFGLGGYARVDFRVDAASRPRIIDINANPCLSPDAGYAAALDRVGIRYEDALECILGAALASCGQPAGGR